MTARADRPCPTPGCPNKITVYAKRCPSCAVIHHRQINIAASKRSRAEKYAALGPARCRVCGDPVPGRRGALRLCEHCRDLSDADRVRKHDRIYAVSSDGPHCSRCGSPVEGRDQGNRVCTACRREQQAESKRLHYTQPKEAAKVMHAGPPPTGIAIYNPEWGGLTWDSYVNSRREPAEVEA